ncbi:cytoskeleton-associated protein 2-like [Dunckerocampus dactyliophorus]|uniref:cytoskeleton-associated protein 2-like n=1 Tax=Dunckerocampus dactyliophorus TaxID=161453 RepID=UPI00240670EC|nr:cytoskeleton-associated protein 2-like [Dunckerocampus dactyliophorus]
MDEEDPAAPVKSRKELRKQKMMEYLTMKGKSKLAASKPNLCDGPAGKPQTLRPSALQLLKGKENKTPTISCRQKDKNSQPLAPLANQKPSRKTFFAPNKENPQSSIRTGPQKAGGLLSLRSTLTEKPSFKATYGVSSKSSLKADGLPTKQTKVRIPPAGKASSNVHFPLPKNSSSTFRAASNTAGSFPIKTYTVRMSLGPMVKTRTGLIPAMIPPKVPTHIANPSAAPSRSGVSSSRPVSKAPSAAQVKKIPVRQRPAVSCWVADKSRPKANLAKQSQPSSLKLKSAFTTTSSRTALHKPPGQPAKQRPEPQERLMSQRSKAHGGVAASGFVAKMAGRALPAAAQAAKPKTGKETAKEDASFKTDPKRTNPAPPGKANAISQPKPPPATKAPKPQTVEKKATAEQEERMRKLQAWREARGISYKRPPMPVKPPARRPAALPQPFWSTLKAEDDARSFIYAVERSLSDCIKMLAEGCRGQQVREVLSRLPPVSQKFAKFWICKARLMEQEGNLDVLPMFEEAVGVVLEPVDELRTVVFDILKKKEESRACEGDGKEGCQTPNQVESSAESNNDSNTMVTPPKPVRALIHGEKGRSSTVKYKITATPGTPSSQQREAKRVNGQKVLFFTPVRRSVRIETASLQYPPSLQEHDPCVASYSDLLAAEEEKESDTEQTSSTDGAPMYVYRENEALQDKMFVQLLREEEEA